MEKSNDIQEELLEEFKERMKIFHSSEDKNLKRILRASFLTLNQTCGEFGFDHAMGKELVFERARYEYNDCLEFFADNFLTEIMNLSVALMDEKDEGEI